MPEGLPPAAIYLIGALLVPFLRGPARQVFALCVPVIGFANLFLNLLTIVGTYFAFVFDCVPVILFDLSHQTRCIGLQLFGRSTGIVALG